MVHEGRDTPLDKIKLIESILGDYCDKYSDKILNLLKYSFDDLEKIKKMKESGLLINKYNIEFVLDAKFYEYEINPLTCAESQNYENIKNKLGEEKYNTFISMLYKTELGTFGGRDNYPNEKGKLLHGRNRNIYYQ